MLESEQRYEAPMPAQVKFWNRWNAEYRETELHTVSIEQSITVSSWLKRLERTDLNIIDIGCGTGWLSETLIQFGDVTGTDLSDQVLERAAHRVPSARFISGDFMRLELDSQSYDVAVSLEVLSHVADQAAFLNKIADILCNDGYLMLATQNRPALEKSHIPPPAKGQIRRWVDRNELLTLLNERFEVIEMFSITPIFYRGWRRFLNSRKLRYLLAAVGLSTINRLITFGAS